MYIVHATGIDNLWLLLGQARLTVYSYMYVHGCAVLFELVFSNLLVCFYSN